LAVSSVEVIAAISTMSVWSSKSGMVLKYPQGIETQFEFQTFSPKCILHRNINYCMTHPGKWLNKDLLQENYM
jgi:hypothetical protein